MRHALQQLEYLCAVTARTNRALNLTGLQLDPVTHAAPAEPTQKHLPLTAAAAEAEAAAADEVSKSKNRKRASRRADAANAGSQRKETTAEVTGRNRNKRPLVQKNKSIVRKDISGDKTKKALMGIHDSSLVDEAGGSKGIRSHSRCLADSGFELTKAADAFSYALRRIEKFNTYFTHPDLEVGVTVVLP